jgi:hypothetical protein
MTLNSFFREYMVTGSMLLNECTIEFDANPPLAAQPVSLVSGWKGDYSHMAATIPYLRGVRLLRSYQKSENYDLRLTEAQKHDMISK